MASVMAGIVFVGHGLMDAPEAQTQSGSLVPPQQVVGDRRVKTADVHAHCAVSATGTLMGKVENMRIS
jgi:hypothetical protein